jgi:hypothetical protein
MSRAISAADDTCGRDETATQAGASVTVYPDGPLVLRGDFTLRQVDGTQVETGRVVALCRCGRSAVKPLCDGSHKRGTL